ncbi:cell wall hydrolase [Chlorobium sp. N1]|uniref:cell wall hydrolase n=1 Tax=Chlorobium sp. N1 TaxID=2491138 RepID=UPI00103D35DA|nr:cell wall hydrolase [Chlorobium sp. N1]TCD47906.1 cell wall hydrolase [Chlorobium sp. N1]
MKKMKRHVRQWVGAFPAKRLRKVGGAVAMAGLFSAGVAARHHHHPAPGHTGSAAEQSAHASAGRLASIDSAELKWLARNIYHEARGESWDGMLAVGVVTLNRVKSSRYPDTIEGVVKQYKQFSWYWDGMADREPNRKAWEKAMAAALEVMLNPDLPIARNLEGVLFYHADYVKPYWADTRTEVATVGRHVFYL